MLFLKFELGSLNFEQLTLLNKLESLHFYFVPNLVYVSLGRFVSSIDHVTHTIIVRKVILTTLPIPGTQNRDKSQEIVKGEALVSLIKALCGIEH